MISIIIPVYNQATKLKKTLDSLLQQTEKDFEVVVVDDASTEDIKSIIDEYKDKFNILKFYRNDVNYRIASIPRNRGLRHADGEYILWLDDDVIMKQYMPEVMKNTLDTNPRVDFVYSSHKFGFKTFRFKQFDLEDIKKGPCIHTTSMIRRSSVPAGGWDEDLRRLQDWDFFLRVMLNSGRCKFIDDVLFSYSPGGIMSSWMPGFVYKCCPFLSKVRKYNEAVAVVREKNGI